MAWAGKKAMLAKHRGWEADHEIHAMRGDGPWVGTIGFALRFSIGVATKSTGQRMQLEEAAMCAVRDGKVVREEFHFAVNC